MFITVLHDISNQNEFFGKADEVVNKVPEGIKPLQFFPSNDGKQAVCLWEAKSVDAVKDYLEPKIGTIAKNTYYAVNSEAAMGLPSPVHQ